MGDNVHLGDRHGVRTPMQWSSDRNAGFSRVEPDRLYSPVITDPVYGYQGVNVETQLRSASSLLGWTRKLVAARKRSKVFGRGTLRFLAPTNTRVLAHLREYRGETVLLVHNLAPSAEAVDLDLAEFRGAMPVELLGGSRFPVISDRPYVLTMAPHGSYWLRLDRPGRPAEAYGIERDSV
jgi:maltose alpha-D-glucosyltransferase/alpha-amylase